MALVTIVVPWAMEPASGASAWSPVNTPRAGASGVVSTFRERMTPEAGSMATRSVNVPPTSMPTRTLTVSSRGFWRQASGLLPLGPPRDRVDHVTRRHVEWPHRPVLAALELDDDRPHASILPGLVELHAGPGHEKIGRLDVRLGQRHPDRFGVGRAGAVERVHQRDDARKRASREIVEVLPRPRLVGGIERLRH